MILALDELPGVTRGWLGSMDVDDPARFAELADEQVIETARCPFRAAGLGSHGGVLRVLDRLDLTGKRIGAFVCAPSTAASPEARLLDYQNSAQHGTAGLPDVLHLGTLGSDLLISTGDTVAALEPGGRVPAPVAPSFEAFVLVTANARDALQSGDLAHFWERADACARFEVLRGVDVGRVFRQHLPV